MKTMFKWMMNPDNNPIMFAVAIFALILAIIFSALRT